jgi:hypothetical protein
MRINGENFKVFLSDTISTIKNRIAVSMKTLPQYLVFNPELESKSQKGDFVVDNAIKFVINSKEMVFPEQALNFELIPREEAEKYFVATHNLNNSSKSEADIEKLLTYTITGLSTLNVPTIWKDRIEIREKLKEKLASLRLEVEKTVRSFEEFENIPSVKSVEFEVNEIQFNISFTREFQPTSIFELFNSIKVTKMAPYANMGSLTKVFHNFTPDPNWLDFETPNVIFLKINGEIASDLRPLKNPFDKFTDAAFTILNGETIATLKINVGHRSVSRDVFIDRLLSAFPTLDRSMITQMKEISTNGLITYPSQVVLFPIWSEFCMNNSFFNKIVSLNESIRASKIKLNAYMYVNNTTDVLILSLKETEKANMFGMEDEGSYFVRVRVKAKTIEDALNYQKILGRLLTIYNNEKDLVLNEYRKYIGSDFLKDEESELIVRRRKLEKLELRTIAPDIFLPTYSRKCLKRPIIISREQAEIHRQKNDKQVMEFPTFGESVKRFYICDHQTHPYPGLRDNALENKKKFPFIPCCYAKDQNREGTKYKFYFSQEKRKDKNSASQNIFISRKTLPPGLPGTLPLNLQELFSIIEPNPEYQFIKIGANVTNSSFIECVMLGLNRENLQFLKVEDRIPIVERIRNDIATEANAMASKQELFDESIPVIMDKLTNSNMDALEFAHVLELVFNCDIFVFSGSDKEPNGTMKIPKHEQAFYKSKPSRTTVFIYQHHTSENEKQCELITRVKVSEEKILDNMETSFRPSEQVVEKVWDVFRNLNRSFSHNLLLPSIIVPRFNIQSQIVDIYGKCRVLNINYDGVMVTMVSDPLPPFNVVNATNIFRAPLATLQRFCKKYKISVQEQRIVNQRLRELKGQLRLHLNVTFLCDDAEIISGIPILRDPEEFNELFRRNETIVSQFGHYKKLAKLIYQYGLFFMSHFMHANGIEEPLNDQQMVDFINSKLVVDPNYSFDEREFSPRFSMNSQFVRRDRLIVTSNEMLKRLIFMFRLFQNNHFEELLGYKDKKFAENYYDEISDFDESKLQFIFDNKEAVKALIENYATDNTVTKNVRIGHPHPYFIHNIAIGDRIYLAQNVFQAQDEEGFLISNLGTAIKLVKFWNQFGFNATKDISLEEYKLTDQPVDVYTFRTNEHVSNLTNHHNPLPGLVVGYLVKGEPVYTALMPI